MRKRSLVLVTVDCLRADHVGFLGYKRQVTPFLDSLAEDSAVFTQAIVAGAPTYFSFPAIMASRYALSLGRDMLGIAPNEPTLATALRESGYQTAAFLAGNPYLTRRFGYRQGFDQFHDFLGAALPGERQAPIVHADKRPSGLNRRLQAASRRARLTAAAYDELYFWYCQWRSTCENLSMDELRRYPAADVIVGQACSWLGQLGDQPFFLWLHLMDPHHPYYPPQAALSSLGVLDISARRARFLNSFWDRGDIGSRRLQRLRAEILLLYDAGVYWVDKQISRLADSLRVGQRWDETVFVVTADHGEEFLEHDARYHFPESLPEQLIRVPLLVRAPGVTGVRISKQPFSLIHLAPTLLEVLDVAVPETFQGQSRWKQIVAADLPSEPAIVESIEACNNPFRLEDRIRPRLLAIRDRECKLVIHFSDETSCLYDLENDPGERSALPIGARTRERVRLLQAARMHLKKTNHNRNAELILRARVDELRQTIEMRRPAATTSPVLT